MALKIDFEFKSLIPALTSEEYAGLEESILKEGCRDALVVWNGIIVDGHNRYEICQKHGIEFKTVEKSFADRDEIKLWIIDNQLARRNLQSIDRLELGFKKEEIIARQANARQAHGLTAPGRTLLPTLVKALPIHTDEKIAKDAGVGRETVRKYRAIKDKPELIEQIKRGESTINRAYLLTKREETRQQKKEAAPLPSDKYRIVYADPPWFYDNSGIIGEEDNYGHVKRHYPTMTVNELCDLPVKDMIEDNAVLFLWVTSPLLAECWPVIKAWGFEYKTSFVWDKVGHNFGHYNSVRHELLLICTRGSCTPDNTKLYDSVQTIEKSDIHSQKPEEFRHIIDDLYTHGKRIELFARETADGWETWGNEL